MSLWKKRNNFGVSGWNLKRKPSLKAEKNNEQLWLFVFSHLLPSRINTFEKKVSLVKNTLLEPLKLYARKKNSDKSLKIGL